MSQNHTLECIILHTYDVGEADRFCVVLSKTQGLLTARAKAVRKPSSKLCGHILPFQKLELELHEGRTGHTITGGRVLKAPSQRTPQQTKDLQTAAQLLMALLHENEAVTEVYDHLYTLLEKQAQYSSALPFTIKTLSTLGLLPNNANHQVYAADAEEEVTLYRCLNGHWHDTSLQDTPLASRMLKLCRRVIEDNASRQVTLLNHA